MPILLPFVGSFVVTVVILSCRDGFARHWQDILLVSLGAGVAGAGAISVSWELFFLFWEHLS